MKVKKGLLKYLAPQADPESRKDTACGGCEDFNSLPAGDRATVLFVLSFDKDPEVAGAAGKAFTGLTAAEALSALEGELDPLVIRRLYEEKGGDPAVEVMAALNPATDTATLSRIAAGGSEEVVLILMDDRERLRRDPSIMDSLKQNPLTSDDAIENLRESVKTLPAPSEAAEKTGKKEEEEQEQSLFKRLQTMAMSDKIKLAFLGNKEARDILIKDPNKIISLAVLKNPRITEDEIVKLSTSKSASDDMLRAIARNKEWVKSYTVKLGMVNNPKTPLNVSLKFLDHLHEKDLAKLAKSRNIPNVLATAARRKAEMKRK